MKIPFFHFTASLLVAAAGLVFGVPLVIAEQGVVITARQAKSELHMGTKKMVFPPADEWKTITISVARNKVRMDSGDGLPGRDNDAWFRHDQRNTENQASGSHQ